MAAARLVKRVLAVYTPSVTVAVYDVEDRVKVNVLFTPDLTVYMVKGISALSSDTFLTFLIEDGNLNMKA
jgi:hypothetical protein